MKYKVQLISEYLNIIIKIIFTIKPRAYIVASPNHPNLGDQAQLLCLKEWISNEYKSHKVIVIPIHIFASHVAQLSGYLSSSIRCYTIVLIMKIMCRKSDIIFGHSGYFFIDHHSGWLAFARLAIALPKFKMVIMPQTINFYNPTISKLASNAFNYHKNLTILCRDKVSYKIAKKQFSKCKLLLFPDIVTSLIGNLQETAFERNGVLLCIRDDVEAYYSKEDFDYFRSELGEYTVDYTDTTIDEKLNVLNKRRKEIIYSYINEMSKYKVVVTDRYHGTIFSVISGTPVVVLNSNDHKLKSGVKWYEDEFSDIVSFSETLSDAIKMVKIILDKPSQRFSHSNYFQKNYYDKLHDLL